VPNTGDVFAGTGENVDRSGLTAWTSPTEIVSDNGTDATCNAGSGSDYLVARNFNFAAIPDGSAIDGVLVKVQASEHSTGTEALLAQLQDESGALVGSSKATANEGAISGTTKAIYSWGSISDRWGANGLLTTAVVKDADFGVRFWFTTSHDIRIDYVTMQIEYTLPVELWGIIRAGSWTGFSGAASGLNFSRRFGRRLVRSRGGLIVAV
jgi:hypothetical protein